MGEPSYVFVITSKEEQTGGAETSPYPEEEKSKEIPLVAVSEAGIAQTFLSSDGKGL